MSCCKDCPDRSQGCHGRCEKYKEEQQARNRYKAKLRRDESIDRYYKGSISKTKSDAAKHTLEKNRYMKRTGG